MDKSTLKAIATSFGLLIISILILSYDQISINTTLVITLIIANFGLVLKNTFDIGELTGRFKIVENYVETKINEDIKGRIK